MYDIGAYGGMIADRGRMAPYAQALGRAVKPGAVVVDIGSGTGIFALIACQHGARKVYAIEPNDAIHVARRIARDNGLLDRIEFIQDISTRVTLEERADVIVSDIRGILPFFERHIPAIIDARTRLLAPGGVLIPRRDTVWAALVSAPELHQRYAGPWNDRPFDLDMSAAADLAINGWGKARRPVELVVPPAPWVTVDYAEVESADADGELTWEVARHVTGHGLVLWFDAELDERAGFTNAPTEPELIYGSAFFPWPSPVALEAGDSVSVRFRARLVGNDYVFTWESRVTGKAGAEKLQRLQSSFFGPPQPPAARLKRQSAAYVPRLGKDGEIDAAILAALAEGKPLGDIARDIQERFHGAFATWTDALTRVGELCVKYAAPDV